MKREVCFNFAYTGWNVEGAWARWLRRELPPGDYMANTPASTAHYVLWQASLGLVGAEYSVRAFWIFGFGFILKEPLVDVPLQE